MRKTCLLLLGTVAIAALAVWAAPEAEASPYAPPLPVLADVYVGFGYGGGCGPCAPRTYVQPTYVVRRAYYRPYYYRPYYRPYYYRPYYYPRVSVGVGFGYGYHGHRYHGHRHHGHYRGHHGGTRRVIGRRR